MNERIIGILKANSRPITLGAIIGGALLVTYAVGSRVAARLADRKYLDVEGYPVDETQEEPSGDDQ